MTTTPAYYRAWRARNREKRRLYDRAYYLAHRAKIIARVAVRDAKRRAERRAYMAGYRATNRDRLTTLTRNWKQTNTAAVKASDLKRRAAKLAGGSFTAEEWNLVLSEYNYACAYCGSREALTADHRVPLSRGGSNDIANIVPACRSCNSRKATKTEAEYRDTLAIDVVEIRPPGL